jgi:hypothetical protein
MSVWFRDELVETARIAEMIEVAAVLMAGLARRRVHGHATDRVTGDCFGVGHGPALVPVRFRGIDGASSRWKVKSMIS